jgi:uncharacterized protein (TIGR02996 family)
LVKDALLAAILADPDDDEARRVYADALIAEGDPRGDFIAMQLAGREADATPFETPYGFGTGARWRWDRGFACALDLTAAEQSIELLREVLEREPMIIDLATGSYDTEATVAQLLLPGVERLRRLAVFVSDGRIVSSPTNLGNLRELRVGNPIGDEGVEAIAYGMSLDNVTHLALGYPITGDSGIRQLARSPLGERLEIFELHRNEITVRMAEDIIAMSSLHTFAYSRGHATRGATSMLVHHFGERAVVCDDEILHVIPRGAERVLALLS